MKKIQNVLKELYNLESVIKHDEIIGENGIIKMQIQPPRANCTQTDEHSRWLLRMAPSKSFDRWSVSTAVLERFDNPEQIVKFLSNTSNVYKQLLHSLSNDYKELHERLEELECGGFELKEGK